MFSLRFHSLVTILESTPGSSIVSYCLGILILVFVLGNWSKCLVDTGYAYQTETQMGIRREQSPHLCRG